MLKPDTPQEIKDAFEKHQEYAESGYPIILNVRLFGNSYRFRGSVQSSVIQLSAQSVLILNFLNLTLPFLKERSISLIYPHFGHLISIFPVVIVTVEMYGSPWNKTLHLLHNGQISYVLL